jgi:hypothetical protein
VPGGRQRAVMSPIDTCPAPEPGVRWCGPATSRTGVAAPATAGACGDGALILVDGAWVALSVTGGFLVNKRHAQDGGNGRLWRGPEHRGRGRRPRHLRGPPAHLPRGRLPLHQRRCGDYRDRKRLDVGWLGSGATWVHAAGTIDNVGEFVVNPNSTFRHLGGTPGTNEIPLSDKARPRSRSAARASRSSAPAAVPGARPRSGSTASGLPAPGVAR